MEERDERFMRVAFEIAKKARKKGNQPFGALLVDEHDQIIMEAENTIETSKDCTGHAETNLMRRASIKYAGEFLAKCTIYTSTEPCPMCAGAIFWGNVGRVVYGLSEEGLYELASKDTKEKLHLPCREVFRRGKKPIEVIGPLLEDEARKVHMGFWN